MLTSWSPKRDFLKKRVTNKKVKVMIDEIIKELMKVEEEKASILSLALNFA
jgi:hypothetical protein